MIEEAYYTARQLEEISGINRQTIRQMLVDGKCEYKETRAKYGGVLKLIPDREIPKLLVEHKTAFPHCNNTNCRFRRWGRCMALTECLDTKYKPCSFRKEL